MKSASAAILSLFSVSLFAGEPNSLTDAERKDGWRLLFDGTTTKDWIGLGKDRMPDQGWSVENGTLHHTKGGGDIVTAEAFENFEFVWEWKIAEVGNSGVKYNLPDPSKGLGFEYQMLDDENHPDGKKGGRLHQTAGLYDLIEPAPDTQVNPPGQWNTSRLVVKGQHVEHWLNGKQTVSFEMGSPEMKEAIARSKYRSIPGFGVKTKSPILLQDHGDEFWVRSIKIRPI